MQWKNCQNHNNKVSNRRITLIQQFKNDFNINVVLFLLIRSYLFVVRRTYVLVTSCMHSFAWANIYDSVLLLFHEDFDILIFTKHEKERFRTDATRRKT